MLLETNLRLLRGQLDHLAETPYFTPQLDKYIADLREIPKVLLERLATSPPIDEGVARFFAHILWSLTQFLTGSTTKQIPYEVVFAVSQAAREWTKSELLLTTAIIHEPNFYFYGIGGQDFFDAAKDELGVEITVRPIQVALPYIYRHRPLFCTPLFHELGHYIDAANEVIKTSLMTDAEDVGPDLPDLPSSSAIKGMSPNQRGLIRQIVERHRKEYFCDLFAAMYVGRACSGFLQEFSPNHPASDTHPSSASREALIEDFLTGKSNPIVELFQKALAARGLPAIAPRFTRQDVDTPFSQVRPATIKSTADLYGIFDAGWTFLMQARSAPDGLWSNIPQHDRERIVNDLTEKSIRNHMIVEGWNASTNTH